MKALNETIVPKVFLVLFGFQERLNKPLHPLLSESELAGAAPRPLPFFPRCRRPPPPTFLHRHHTHSCTTAAQPNPRLLLLLAIQLHKTNRRHSAPRPKPQSPERASSNGGRLVVARRAFRRRSAGGARWSRICLRQG